MFFFQINCSMNLRWTSKKIQVWMSINCKKVLLERLKSRPFLPFCHLSGVVHTYTEIHMQRCCLTTGMRHTALVSCKQACCKVFWKSLIWKGFSTSSSFNDLKAAYDCVAKPQGSSHVFCLKNDEHAENVCMKIEPQLLFLNAQTPRGVTLFAVKVKNWLNHTR